MAAKRADPVAATRESAGTIWGALEWVRLEIVRRKDERAAVEQDVVTADIAQARLAEFCERLESEAHGRFDVSRFASPHYRTPGLSDLPAASAGVLVDLIRSVFSSRIADAYRDRDGITDQDRAAKLAAIDAHLLRLELSEEAIIREAERANLEILRRANADPRAVLAFDEDLT